MFSFYFVPDTFMLYIKKTLFFNYFKAFVLLNSTETKCVINRFV